MRPSAQFFLSNILAKSPWKGRHTQDSRHGLPHACCKTPDNLPFRVFLCVS